MPIEITSPKLPLQSVDLDIVSSWPATILSDVGPLLSTVLAEKDADLQYALSGDRWHKPSPTAPATTAAIQIIRREMEDRRIRVFHATRLIDFESVQSEGLHPLNLDRQIDFMKNGLVAAGRFTSLREIDDLLAGVDLDDDFFRGREGQIWATPLRRLLHDGGCDVFFKHWGGEALQRLAHTVSADLEAKIRSLGTPAVVTFNIPAFGCCTRSDYRLAPTMLGLMLERAGLIERNYEAWDVLLKRPIPTEWIESVQPNDDPALAELP
jgi:hypothetical protein